MVSVPDSANGSGYLYGGGDPERYRRARDRRAARISRFTETQRRTREWINFAEIAEWCSKEDGSIVPNESKRTAAFDALQRDLLAGEFEEDGRSRVLYLNPESTMAKMTRQRLQGAKEVFDTGSLLA
jgi:hypothetical protein